MILAMLVACTIVACTRAIDSWQPSGYPRHDSDRFFGLHWRLERADGVVRAVGLVEATRVDGIAEVLLETAGAGFTSLRP